jgi:large subunit ribosomal protein L15
MPLHMRLPKLRGFRNPAHKQFQVVNLDKLAELYPKGGEVTVADLVAKGAVRKNELVKVLGTGEISVALTVTVNKVSGSAKEKITAAGGTVTELG